MPTPIAAMVGEKTGVQDSHSRVSNKVCHRFCFPRGSTLDSPLVCLYIQDEYKLDKARVALEAHGTYICSCNLYWLDGWKSPAPGVPLSRARVQQLASFYFPPERNNNFFQRLLDVQVNVASLTDKPTGLVVISPLEMIHAIYLKAAEELGQPGVTAACKAAWTEALTLGHTQFYFFCTH